MQQERIPKRARVSALLLLAALAVVLIVHLAVGLNDVLLFGLVGGLVGSLVVVGLDLLRNAQRTVDTTLPAARDDDDAGEVRQ